MSNPVKTQLKRFRPALIGYIAGRTLWSRLRFSAGDIDSFGGSLNVHLPIETSLNYIHHVVDDFIRYGPLRLSDIAGRRVMELGPGDNVGVSLMFLAKGATEAVCADKFYSIHDKERERRLYVALREDLSVEEKRRFDDAVDLTGELKFNESRIRYIYGVGSEDVQTIVPANSFDLVLSRGVLQGVDLEKSFVALQTVLAPGGVSLHKSDLRDHGMFSSNGYHPLEFLTIPDTIYNLMSRGTDRPNRKQIRHYRDLMKKYGFEGEIYRSGIITRKYIAVPQEIVPHKLDFVRGVDYRDEDVALIDEIRPRLQPEYRSMPDQDLLTAGIFIVARKPA